MPCQATAKLSFLSLPTSPTCARQRDPMTCVCACPPGPRGFVPAGKLQPYCPVQSQQPGMQMPALESSTEGRQHSYAAPEAPRPQVATFTPAFQVRVGDTRAPRAIPSNPTSSMLVPACAACGWEGGPAFPAHTWSYMCSHVHSRGVSQPLSEYPVRLVSALLGPGVDRARELCSVGSPVSFHHWQYCAALLETTSMSLLGPALPMSFPPLTLASSKGFLPPSPAFHRWLLASPSQPGVRRR